MKFKNYFIPLLIVVFIIIIVIINNSKLDKSNSVLHIDIYKENIYYAEDYDAKDLLKIQKTILGYYEEKDMMKYDINNDGDINDIDRDIVQFMNIGLYPTYSSYDWYYDIKFKMR